MANVALILGGADHVMAEYEAAKAMCVAAKLEYTVFIINDMIASFPEYAEHAVSLHPPKIPGWLRQREVNRFPPPRCVWAHIPLKVPPNIVTNHTPDWAGSSGLFSIKIAREQGHEKIILCGVPMEPGGNHFVRNQRWNACQAFWRAWVRHQAEIAPYVRSMSGRTQQTFGAPTPEWLSPPIVVTAGAEQCCPSLAGS